MLYKLFVSCPRNMEYLLEDELVSLGLPITKVSPQGVYADANLKLLYEICIWSRIANRVQLILFSGEVFNEQSLNKLCSEYHWSDVFSVDKTIAIHFHGEAAFINNSMYGAQLVKDGIVDYFKQFGDRPNVDKKNPDIRLHAHLKRNTLTVSLDLMGYSLHQRGYRSNAGEAPIKENVAASILQRVQWKNLAAEGYRFVDPFCGSGTFVIEAAMIAANIAPGLLRHNNALSNWCGHDAELWGDVVADAKSQRTEAVNPIIGYDVNKYVLNIARDNAMSAGVEDLVSFEHQSIEDYKALPAPGLWVCNPPYGERLEDPISLMPLYQSIGRTLFTKAQGWRAAILTSQPILAQSIGLRSDKQYTFFNGSLEAKLYCIHVDETNQLKLKDQNDPNTSALLNRLKKNKKHLGKWLKRTKQSCYRLYDADLPEYAFAVDIYDDWAHVQEYVAPKEVPVLKAKKRVLEMLAVLPGVLDIPEDHIVLKQRMRQKGSNQYEAFDKRGETFEVSEGSARLIVNLHDYLDTGLFLDHRLLRLHFGRTLKGQRFLNCFCYTATASVHAALSGAITTNVDLSYTYLNWAKDNFRLNKITFSNHEFIQADCLEWLKNCKRTFNVIFLDPPSFSNSKRMQTTLDIQRDQELLIDLAMQLLAPEGALYFSNNLKKFKLSSTVSEKYLVKDVSMQYLDEDFKRSKSKRHCYTLKWLPSD